jgi:hypothetical protein
MNLSREEKIARCKANLEEFRKAVGVRFMEIAGVNAHFRNPYFRRPGTGEELYKKTCELAGIAPNPEKGTFYVLWEASEVQRSNDEDMVDDITTDTYGIYNDGKKVGEIETEDFFGESKGWIGKETIPDLKKFAVSISMKTGTNYVNRGLEGLFNLFLRNRKGYRERVQEALDETELLGAFGKYGEEMEKLGDDTKAAITEEASGYLKDKVGEKAAWKQEQLALLISAEDIFGRSEPDLSKEMLILISAATQKAVMDTLSKKADRSVNEETILSACLKIQEVTTKHNVSLTSLLQCAMQPTAIPIDPADIPPPLKERIEILRNGGELPASKPLPEEKIKEVVAGMHRLTKERREEDFQPS